MRESPSKCGHWPPYRHHEHTLGAPLRRRTQAKMAGAAWLPQGQNGALIMKTVLNAFVALSVLAGSVGVAASAHAFDAKTFWETLDKTAR
jgi:hypothetical protein